MLHEIGDDCFGLQVVNAAMESFFSTLKIERTNRTQYASRDEARADVFDYIERFYNAKRRPATLRYLSQSTTRNRRAQAEGGVNGIGSSPYKALRMKSPRIYPQLSTRGLKEFNAKVDAASIPYKPQSDNSNAYAGTAYKQLTNQKAPNSSSRPGSGNDLKNKPGVCRGTRVGNSGTGSIC